MTTSKGKEIIDSGWKAAGISDAVKLGSSKLSSNRHLLALCDATAEEFELFCGKKLGTKNDDAVT